MQNGSLTWPRVCWLRSRFEKFSLFWPSSFRNSPLSMERARRRVSGPARLSKSMASRSTSHPRQQGMHEYRVAFPSWSQAAGFFFHEYGRRVGGVPRSSLKGKETLHDEGEKNTSNPKTKQKLTKQTTKTRKPKRHQGPEAGSPSSISVSSVRG